MLNDKTLAKNLLELFQSMKDEPMSDDDYAEKLAKIIDDQIKTAEVQAGIAVSTAGNQNTQTGKTTAAGKLL